MIGVRVDLREWDKFIDGIGITTEAAKLTIKPLAEELFKALKSATPVDTGKMRDAWKMEAIPFPGGMTGYIIKNDHPAVQFVEMGTRNYRIVPVKKTKKQALKFEMDGEIRFFKWVDHPGVSPRAFARQTTRKFYTKYPYTENVIQVVLVGNPEYRKQQTIVIHSNGWKTR